MQSLKLVLFCSFSSNKVCVDQYFSLICELVKRNIIVYFWETLAVTNSVKSLKKYMVKTSTFPILEFLFIICNNSFFKEKSFDTTWKLPDKRNFTYCLLDIMNCRIVMDKTDRCFDLNQISKMFWINNLVHLALS